MMPLIECRISETQKALGELRSMYICSHASPATHPSQRHNVNWLFKHVSRTFVGVLRAIATAMEKMVEGTDAAADPVVHSFGKLAEAFHLKHKLFNSAMQIREGRENQRDQSTLNQGMTVQY